MNDNINLHFTETLNLAIEKEIILFRTLNSFVKFCKKMDCTTCGTYYQAVAFKEMVENKKINGCGKRTLENIKTYIKFCLNNG